MQKSVDGKIIDLTPGEITQLQIDQAAWTAKANNRIIKAQIDVLEASITDRRWRDYTFGTESPPGWMAAINMQIQTLRAQLT